MRPCTGHEEENEEFCLQRRAAAAERLITVTVTSSGHCNARHGGLRSGLQLQPGHGAGEDGESEET